MMRNALIGAILMTGLVGPTSLLAADPPSGSNLSAPVPITIERYQVGPDVYVRALSADPYRRSLWVGTSVGVLEIGLDTKQVKSTFTRKDGLANEYVFAAAVGPDQRVWFGTNAGGVSTLLGGEWKIYFPMHGLADYWVYAFAFDKNKDVWIGTWDGASHFDSKTGKFTNYRDELINIWVYGIDIDARGRVWFGTEGGVSMLDGSNWRSWTHKDGLGAPNTQDLPESANRGLGTRSRHDLNVLADGATTYNPDYVFSVLVDRRDQAIWFGTWGGGAARFDGRDSWKSYSTSDGLVGSIVYSIAQEPGGALWFGTDRGVSRFDGRNWSNFTQRDGLVGNHTYALAITEGPVIWIASKGGVSRISYDPKEKGKSK